jgi:hypothetical protein
MIKVGDKIETWFSGRADRMSTVLDIEPYSGRYPESFNCVLKLTALDTYRGFTKMAYKND